MLASFKAWLDQPFSTGMTATRWFAFVGLLLVIMMFWGTILAHMREL